MSYKVSVLVPIYGVEKYIARCVTSLFEQTYNNIEYIFVNDCTKDNSLDVLNDILSKYPNRANQVKIITHDVNRGLGCARNTAVESSTGLFVIHVDSDDYLSKDCLSFLVSKQMSSKSDIVSCDICRIRKNGNIIHRIPDYKTPACLNYAIIKHSIPNNIWGRLIRRSLYIDNNIKVSKGINMSEDLNVLPRLLYFSEKVDVVNDVLYFYDCSNQSSYTSTFSEEKSRQCFETLFLLSSFFKDKGEQYMKCMNYRIINTYANQLKDCVKTKGHMDYYMKLRKSLDECENLDFNNLNILNRFGLYIGNYYLFRFYVLFFSFLKKIGNHV